MHFVVLSWTFDNKWSALHQHLCEEWARCTVQALQGVESCWLAVAKEFSKAKHFDAPKNQPLPAQGDKEVKVQATTSKHGNKHAISPFS